jgi:hypothetical protein
MSGSATRDLHHAH